MDLKIISTLIYFWERFVASPLIFNTSSFKQIFFCNVCVKRKQHPCILIRLNIKIAKKIWWFTNVKPIMAIFFVHANCENVYVLFKMKQLPSVGTKLAQSLLPDFRGFPCCPFWLRYVTLFCRPPGQYGCPEWPSETTSKI